MFRGSFRGGGGGSGVIDVISIDSTDSPYALPLSATVLAVDSSSGVVNVNLPAASASQGIIYYVKNTAGATSNRVRVMVSSGTIDGDGETHVDLENDKASVTLVSDGSDYLIIG